MRPVVLLFVLAVALAGCTASTSPTAGPADGAVLGGALCAATDAETATAARSSFATAHDGLHALARELQAAEARSSAARLLEAKQRVEAAVADEMPLHDLAPRLEDDSRPLVVVVSTPTYCVSQFCGPITETIAELAETYDDRADFVHLEVWEDFENTILNSAAAAWIQTEEGGAEPWVFYVGTDGTIQARWDNVLDEAELVERLDAL